MSRGEASARSRAFRMLVSCDRCLELGEGCTACATAALARALSAAAAASSMPPSVPLLVCRGRARCDCCSCCGCRPEGGLVWFNPRRHWQARASRRLQGGQEGRGQRSGGDRAAAAGGSLRQLPAANWGACCEQCGFARHWSVALAGRLGTWERRGRRGWAP